MSHKIYEVGDYSSSGNESEDEKLDSNSDSDIVLSVRRGRGNGSRLVYTAKSNVTQGNANVPVTRRADFSNDYEESQKEDVIDMKHGSRNHVANVVPSVANLEAAEVVGMQRSKPRDQEKKKSITKGLRKGKGLTADDAVAFMIKERQMLDEEFAAMRRENYELKQELRIKQEPTVIEKVVVDPNSKKQAEDLEKLRRENIELKKKKADVEILFREKRPHSDAAKKITSKRESSESSNDSSESSDEPSEPDTKLKKGVRNPQESFSDKDKYKSAKLSDRTSSVKKPVASLPLTGKKFNSLPAVLWDGGKLWKVPYNGKGMPEERIVMIKRALRPGPQARPVRILSKGEENTDGAASVPVAYIAYPPAIIWYSADKPNESKFAREIVLVDGAYLVDGHQTPAFWKMVNRGTPMPPKELCFSIVTSTRTLDLAAETLREANAWKNAIHLLLVMMTTNKEWGIQNLHRDAPTWHHDSILRGTPANTKKPQENQAPPKPQGGMLKEQMFTATRLNNFSALDDLLRNGVPVNLMEAETADTPLMLACRMNFPVIAKLCLDYGAKNDPHPDFGQTALHAAVAAGSYDCVDVLLDAAAPSGADSTIANLPDPRGETPLHTAAMLGHGAIAELLISHGGKLGTPDAEGKTAIHLSSIAGHRACLAAMLDQGGDEVIEGRDTGGNTALHLAAEYGHFQVVKLLLETAADTSKRNNRGHTPYAIASAKGHHQVGILLLDYASGSIPTVKRSSNHARSFADSGLGRRAISDTRAQLEQERLRQQAFGVADEDASGGAFTLDVVDQEHQPHKTLLKRQNSYPSEVSYVLPRPHTSGNANSPGNNIPPRANGNSLLSPLAIDKNSNSKNNNISGMLSARNDYYSSVPLGVSDQHRGPNTARERPTPTLFEGLRVNKASHAPNLSQLSAERQYSGSPGRNVVNGDRDMAEYYSYVKRNGDAYQEPLYPINDRRYANERPQSKTEINSPSHYRGVSTPVQQHHVDDEYDNGYSSYVEPHEEFDAIGHRWQVFRTEEGYYYYLIQGSEHSQWDDPRTHGYQAYTEAADELTVPAAISPVKCHGQPQQISVEEIGNPGESFKHPKALDGKKKPVERVKHVRAVKRAPKKIELDVTPTMITPDTDIKRKYTRKARVVNGYDTYDDEDSFTSDGELTTDDLADVNYNILSGLRQQSSLDEFRGAEKSNADDSDGYLTGDVPDIRLVERKRASPVRLAEQESKIQPPNEYYADVSGFVRRNLLPLELGSEDDDDRESSNRIHNSEHNIGVVDIYTIPLLEDNLLVVTSPDQKQSASDGPARISSPVGMSTPPKIKPKPRTSPSVADIKNIDSYWRQSLQGSEKRTPRSRAEMAMLSDTASVGTTKTAATGSQDETENEFRQILEVVKSSLPPRDLPQPNDDDEWDDGKSQNEGDSDWDEDMHKAKPLFQKQTMASEFVNSVHDACLTASAVSSSVNTSKPHMSERDLLRERQFNTKDGSYGNGGNSFDSSSCNGDLQQYLDMMYTMSARSIKAQMENNGECKSLIEAFVAKSEDMDLTTVSSVVTKREICSKN